MNFENLLARWPLEARENSSASAEMVTDVLHRTDGQNLSPDDFLVLLSPAAEKMLEEIAQKAHELTLRNFGRAVSIFTPLYISDVCTNHCRYCGFNANNRQKRRHLSVDEAVAEARAIAEQGFQHILLLTGDAPKLSSPQYIAGVESMTMFQETYNPELYAWLHPKGPKSNYAFRLGAPARAASAGMRSIGLGALLGLEAFERDAFASGLHAWWLMRKFPGVEVSVSIPRICPHEGDFDVTNGVNDRKFVQYVIALRCFLPRAGITCSSRESAFMRDHLVPLGVTRVSAGVSTAVGGRATEDLHNPGQFEISDHRSLEDMMADLAKNGYQAVLKDWEDPLA